MGSKKVIGRFKSSKLMHSRTILLLMSPNAFFTDLLIIPLKHSNKFNSNYMTLHSPPSTIFLLNRFLRDHMYFFKYITIIHLLILLFQILLQFTPTRDWDCFCSALNSLVKALKLSWPLFLIEDFLYLIFK